MTLDEAEKLAELFAEVDSGCCARLRPVCVRCMINGANEKFPYFIWEYPEDYGPVTVKASGVTGETK